MDITITLGDAGLIVIGLLIIIFLFYLISLLRNLIPAAKSLCKIMEDTEVVTGVAAESAVEVQKVVGDVKSSVSTVSDIIKGNQSVISALTSIINSLMSLKNLLNKGKKD